MDWGKAIGKGLLGLATWGTAYLAANPQVLTHLIPENIEKMTVGGLVAAGIVFITNVVKNWGK